jgi:hypothetical protein
LGILIQFGGTDLTWRAMGGMKKEEKEEMDR